MTLDEVRSWWSFQKLTDPPVPVSSNENRPRNEIDQFILSKLEELQLTPSPVASRVAWLRRATFDLTGLPPTIAEFNQFVNDRSDNAVEKVVERLLDSPDYGRTWARYWLDVARYADFHDANPKTRTASCEITEAWRYRDWVVDAFNSDMPYDQFIRHQIAGDLMKHPAGDEVYPEGLIATTFLANGVWDRGDADKEKIISDMVDDNIDTIGKAFLGLTLGCARCHDHKFDPISTEDYYALAGIFYSTHILKELGIKGGEYTMNRVPIVPKSVIVQREKQEAKLKSINDQIVALVQKQRYADLMAGGITLVPTSFHSSSSATALISDDGTVFIESPGSKDNYELKAVTSKPITCRYVRLEAIADPMLPANGPGHSGSGNFVLTRFRMMLKSATAESSSFEVKWKSAQSDFAQASFPAAGAIDDNQSTGWAIDPASGTNHVAVFELDQQTILPEGSEIQLVLEHQHSDAHNLGKFRVSIVDQLASSSPDGEEKRALLAQQKTLQAELATPLPVAMAVQEGGMTGGLFPNIQDVPIHIRGSYTKLGQVVPRRMPRFLAGEQPPISSGSGRQQLAEFVASRDNPLTARVIVNRVWQWHFGEGLVRTPSNFGKLGERPTHPELLDWLASRFIDDGWSLKKLHRRIMLSATYLQGSQPSPNQQEIDPENRWLSHFTSHRMTAEAIRDAILCVTNQLNPTAGGPADDDFTSSRRSLYVQTARWDRSSYAMLFDAANPDSSTEKRTMSTVAPQALMFLNHNFIQRQAQQLATRLKQEVPDDKVARIQHAFQLLFGRMANSRELQVASDLIATCESADSDGWNDFAHVLLCCNEFIYLD